jgi:hypothetical protein
MKQCNFKIEPALNPQSPIAVAMIEHILENLDVQAGGDLLTDLPLIKTTALSEPPFDIHFFLCCRLWENAFRFFYSMIRRWLIPGKELNILMQFAIDFNLPDVMPDKLMAAQITLECANALDKEMIARNLPALLAELKLGLLSVYQANKILETRGLTYDEKTAFVQARISQLIQHRPQDFDYDVLTEMQRFLVFCREDFKRYRSARHLSRIICVQYLFRKALKLSLDALPDRRFVSVKLLPIHLQNKQKVLGVAIAVSFLKENEIFEARHVLSAIKLLIPRAQKVEGSFYVPPAGSDGIYFLYLEIEKPCGDFTMKEMAYLKQQLPLDLPGRIEQRHHSIFMPQNEEMVMRHIVTLTQQLTSVKDIPQVIIEFSSQSEAHIEFLVIMLRLKTLAHASIRHLFELHASDDVIFTFDRQKTVGALRKKYKKEAVVFRLKLEKTPYLRFDHSVDLYKARKQIVAQLRAVIGDFRDYNGGTISKETELFDALKLRLDQIADENHFFLENFFFSINPPVMRSILPPEPVARLFNMMIDAKIDGLASHQDYQIRIEEDHSNYYLLAITREAQIVNEFLENHHELLVDSHQVATCLVEESNLCCFGVICCNHDPEEARELWYLLEKALDQKISVMSR